MAQAVKGQASIHTVNMQRIKKHGALSLEGAFCLLPVPGHQLPSGFQALSGEQVF